jgi:hypothetical protein
MLEDKSEAINTACAQPFSLTFYLYHSKSISIQCPSTAFNVFLNMPIYCVPCNRLEYRINIPQKKKKKKKKKKRKEKKEKKEYRINI